MRPPAAPASPYHIALRDLPATRHIDVAGEFVAALVVGMPLRDVLGGEHGTVVDGGEVDVEATADGTTVFVQGAVRGTIAIACSRCVTPVAVTLDERIHVTYVPVAELAPTARPEAGDEDEGEELASDDLDVMPYDGDHLDLSPLVREQFVLAVPYAPLCKDDCLGLCPQCGIDRNHGTCTCVRPVDPRLVALAGVKLPS